MHYICLTCTLIKHLTHTHTHTHSGSSSAYHKQGEDDTGANNLHGNYLQGKITSNTCMHGSRLVCNMTQGLALHRIVTGSAYKMM